MKPIKKGMTEAITRDGRKVTQLTWFDGVDSYYRVGGVLDGSIETWTEGGRLSTHREGDADLFAVPQYEYKVLYKNYDSEYKPSDYYYKSKEDFHEECPHLTFILLIEDSKREC